MSVPCPDCGQKLALDGGEIGDYFECDECLLALSIVSLEPPKVELVEEEK